MATQTRSRNTGNKTMTSILIYIFLIGALGTFAMPVIRVSLPPLGEKAWSVLEVVKPVLQSAGGRRQKQGQMQKVDYDFVDILKEVLPHSAKTNQPRQLSATFLAGILVPIALLASYLLLLVLCCFPLMKRNVTLATAAIAAVLTSVYALAGTFYLGHAAQQSVQAAAEKAGSGILGMITKNLVQQISIRPDTGLYALAVLCALVYLTGLYRREKE